MRRPTAISRSLLQEMARRALSPDTSDFLKLAGRTGVWPSSGGSLELPDFDPIAIDNTRAAPDARKGSIGIWEPQTQNGETYYIRSLQKMDQWRRWANIGKIEPKGHRLRVVLIGESVARGYLYDPLYTPAQVLERILNASAPVPYEVIDLARTSLSLEGMKALVRDAQALRPDFVVIFCGNNWQDAWKAACPSQDIDGTLRDDGIAGLKKLAEAALVDRIRDTVTDVVDQLRMQSIPAVWVIPEFNLGEWRDPPTPPPQSRRADNQAWWELYDKARAAFGAGEEEQGRAFAHGMQRIDLGTVGTADHLLADSAWRAGNLAVAKMHLESARDAVIWDVARWHSPRIFSLIQGTMRECLAHNSLTVDIGSLFETYLQSPIPDGRVFLDYCHLTSTGIKIAMAACAAKILSSTGASVESLRLEALAPTPPPKIEAEAEFMAAIHSAHLYQSEDTVRKHCARALATDPSVVDLMANFVEVQLQNTPMFLSKAMERLCKTGSANAQHYLLGTSEQQFDAMLVDAIGAETAAAGHVALSGRAAQLRHLNHSVAKQPIDLLRVYYLAPLPGFLEIAYARVVSQRNILGYHYTAYWPETRFQFVGEAGIGLCLDMVCRLPGGQTGAKDCLLSVNGRDVGTIEVGDIWEEWELRLPSDVMVEGINELRIFWPTASRLADDRISTFADGFHQDHTTPPFQVFGEIQKLTASQLPFAVEAIPTFDGEAIMGRLPA